MRVTYLPVWLAALASPVDWAQGIPQWSVQEIVLEAKRRHVRPYAADLVQAEISGPGGARFSVPGFWDGGNTFRIRWTPTVRGRWTYSTRSSDPGLNGARGEIEVAGPARWSHGFLRRDVEYPYTFVYDDGTRYFLFGNTYYGLLRSYLTKGGWKEAVDQTRAKGMNKIRFYVDGGSEGEPPEEPERPDLEKMRALDKLVSYLAEREIVADLIALRRSRVNAMSIEQAKNWMRYLVARYAAFPNVAWCLTNEWEYSNKPKEFWAELGRFMAREDPWARRGEFVRALSVHQQTRYDWEMPDDSWFSHAIIQFGVRNRGKAHRGGDEWKRAANDWKNAFRHGDDWGYFGIEYNRGRNYPVVNDEYGYIGEPADETEPRGADGSTVRYSREKHRRTMWGIYLAGGFGSAGDKNLYPEGRPYMTAFWKDTPEWEDVRLLIDFFTKKGFEWWKMSPHKEIVKSGERVYVLAEPGRQYIVYAAAGGECSIVLPAGSYEVRRYDPRTGEDVAIGTVSGPGLRAFRMPDEQDWVLYFRAWR